MQRHPRPPGLCAGPAGVLPPPAGYLERLRTTCDRRGVLLIFDEVITGFGRLGTAFAAERFAVVPDLLVCAKRLTNGTIPMGAVAVRQHVHDAFVQGPPRRDRARARLHHFRPPRRLGGRHRDPRHLRARAVARGT